MNEIDGQEKQEEGLPPATVSGRPMGLSKGDYHDNELTFHHPQIAGAVLFFCLGLLVIGYVLPKLSATPGPMSSTQAWQFSFLKFSSLGASLLYWFTRKEEGDCRALVFVVLGLFIGSEISAYFEEAYSPDSERRPSLLLAINVLIFSGLAFTASLADSAVEIVSRKTGGRRLRKVLMIGVLFMALISLLRIAAPVLSSIFMEQKPAWPQKASLVLNILMIAYFAWVLFSTRKAEKI